MRHQSSATPQEMSAWKSKGAVKSADELWRGPTGSLVLPMGELSKKALSEVLAKLRMWWHPNLSDIVWEHCNTCETCQSFNVRPTLRPLPETLAPALWPGADVSMDFTDMQHRVGGKRFFTCDL